MRKRLTQVRAYLHPFAILILALAFAAAISSSPELERVFKTTEPFHTAYLTYSRFKNGAHTPQEVGEGKSPTQILLNEPMGIAEDDNGTVYVSDRKGYIWSVDPNGKTEIVAGTGTRGMSCPDVPARECHFGVIQSVRVSPSGQLYFADGGNHMILRIDEDGVVRRVLGLGFPAKGPDEEDALSMPIFEPHDVCFAPDGTLYATDVFNHRIIAVDTDGVARVVAGTGKQGFSGLDGPATQTMLRKPYGLAVDKEGRLLIADSGNNCIRRLEEDGTLHIIAGTGKQGYTGDGGPAAEATLNQPQCMLVDEKGGVYVSDEHNFCIRYIDTEGTIRTVAGNGKSGADGDGGPATQARLDDPEGICLRKDGSLLIAQSTGQVRQVTTSGEIKLFAGRKHN